MSTARIPGKRLIDLRRWAGMGNRTPAVLVPALFVRGPNHDSKTEDLIILGAASCLDVCAPWLLWLGSPFTEPPELALVPPFGPGETDVRNI